MSTSYNGKSGALAAYGNAITIPSDGDDGDVASVNVAFQKLQDNVQYVKEFAVEQLLYFLNNLPAPITPDITDTSQLGDGVRQLVDRIATLSTGTVHMASDIEVDNAGSNKSGIVSVGDGTGDGIHATGGDSGDGGKFYGGSAGNNGGIYAASAGSGIAGDFAGSTTSAAVVKALANVSSDADGVIAYGAGTGYAFHAAAAGILVDSGDVKITSGDLDMNDGVIDLEYSGSGAAAAITQDGSGVGLSVDCSGGSGQAMTLLADPSTPAKSPLGILAQDADPSSATLGDVMVTSASHADGAGYLKIYNGSNWVKVGTQS